MAGTRCVEILLKGYNADSALYHLQGPYKTLRHSPQFTDASDALRNISSSKTCTATGNKSFLPVSTRRVFLTTWKKMFDWPVKYFGCVFHVYVSVCSIAALSSRLMKHNWWWKRAMEAK